MPEYQYALIIPAWNEAAFIESTLQLAFNAMNDVPQTGQLIVVDNNSSDNTAKLAEVAGAQVVFEPINQIARARNAGAKAADASMLVFLDADTCLSAELLGKALSALESGNVVGGGGNICGDRDAGKLADVGMRGWNWFSRTFKLAAGCFLFTRVDAFEAIGGFPLERFVGEELVLSRRLRRWGKSHGMKFIIIPEPLIETSLRKMDWYSTWDMVKQGLVAILPGSMGSKKRMYTWYDESIERSKVSKPKNK